MLVHIHIYIYMYVCIYIYIYIHTLWYLHLYISLYIYIYMKIHISTYTCMYIKIYTYNWDFLTIIPWASQCFPLLQPPFSGRLLFCCMTSVRRCAKSSRRSRYSSGRTCGQLSLSDATWYVSILWYHSYNYIL